jgi:RNA polymerase sigma-70 factor (ECF subfamily)
LTVWTPDDPDEESRLVQAAKDDLDRFAPIYERYAPRIYAYCLRRVGSPPEAEDLTSQVFTQALAGIGGYRGGLVGAWLFQIAANAVVDHLRCRHVPISLDDTDLMQEGPGVIDDLVQREERRQIRALVASLPEDQQELLALRITAGLSAEETGAVVGKSAGAIRTAVHRTLKRLRALYEENERKDEA